METIEVIKNLALSMCTSWVIGSIVCNLRDYLAFLKYQKIILREGKEIIDNQIKSIINLL